MPSFFEKLKKTAQEIGRTMGNDPKIKKTAENLKQSVEAFVEGYKEKQITGAKCPKCTAAISEKDNFCAKCGFKIP